MATLTSLLARYARWLHTGWPAGTVEPLPVVEADGSTRVPGLYVVGDLTGVPLLKFAADSGARAVGTILESARFRALSGEEALDLVIIGAGISGTAAALEARRRGLRFALLEANQPFATIANFPREKPIYTYPTDMHPAGALRIEGRTKEELLASLRAQAEENGIVPRRARAECVRRRGPLLEVRLAGEDPLLAKAVVVAIGRTGDVRRLGVPGEDAEHVFNRLHDPRDFAGRRVLVVGGGDSAIEAAIALVQCGAQVTLSYRGRELTRPKPENLAKLEALRADPSADVAVEEPTSERVTTATGRFLRGRVRPGRLTLLLATEVAEIRAEEVLLSNGEAVPCDAVFVMIGRDPPLAFFRRSGVPIRGEIRGWGWVGLLFAAALFALLYVWKAGGLYEDPGHWPSTLRSWLASFGPAIEARVADRSSLLGVLVTSASSRSFYFTLLYSLLVVVFGFRRIRRRKTPYITAQTLCLMAVQVFPLFLLPELLLPWLGANGAWESGWGKSCADALFPLYAPGLSDLQPPEWGHPRAYWKAYGLVLAWPLNVYNVFTPHPQAAWLAISALQTLVLIPLLVWRFGKGAYCGWICSCGALAETLGDDHRSKMPHGPRWNRLNLLGQAVLGVALLLLLLRVLGWIWPRGAVDRLFPLLLDGRGSPFPYLSYKWVVDIFLAGVLGLGLYFHFSGRVWCRFACPLAALMHVYARFGQFRILADKSRCISCNVCTSVCHQGIDVMGFANKGLPMEDPECVRCSACVRSCPTGVLQFGRVDRRSGAVLAGERLPASPVRRRETGRALPLTRS